jgi:hypothetical protein
LEKLKALGGALVGWGILIGLFVLGNVLLPSHGDVEIETDRLRSSSPVDRAWAACYLGRMGKKATPAIPQLVALLEDHSLLQWIPPAKKDWPGANGSPTSPANEALKALIAITGEDFGPEPDGWQSWWTQRDLHDRESR